MTQALKTYIMCGGSGTRLWPLSRSDNPKQMLRLLGGETMLEATIERAASIRSAGDVSVNIIGSHTQQEGLEALPGVDAVLIEPSGRNTAAAVALAVLHAQTADDPHVLILPSDHAIETNKQLGRSIDRGLQASEQDRIVTFGIEPDRPATSYGYIEAASDEAVSAVVRFVEKPDAATAQTYLESGRHLWNAGIFLAKTSTLLAELQAHAPDILSAARAAYESGRSTGRIATFDPGLYAAVPANSIDYALMEKSGNVSVVQAEFSWTDIGSFAALKQSAITDAEGNTIQGDVVTVDTKKSLLYSEGLLLATLGLDNIAAVATPDTTFIAPLDRSEEVKDIVARLKRENRSELTTTPWKAEGGAVPGAMADTFRRWLFESALSFWLEHGLDRDHGGFHEVLDFAGKTSGANKRLRTMARQVYVLAKAAGMGWDGDAAAAVRHGLDFFKQAKTAPRGGWFKTFDAGGKPLDRTEDTYDHAFILLAAAQALRAGFTEARPIAHRVLDFLQNMEMRTPDGDWNGYHEDDRGTLPRRSNPHMHLLEAFLAWHEASGDAASLSKASHIVGLFQDNFFCRDTLFLREEFDATLSVDAMTSSHMEPGHHFEWAWLLHRYARLSEESLIPEARGLIAAAKAFGINPVSKLAWDRIKDDGRPSHQTSRCWPQTEYLKAELVLARHGLPHAVFAAERAAERLWKHHIAPAPDGMWNDVCDVAGKPVAQAVPASTFYHLICAMDVYLRFHAET